MRNGARLAMFVLYVTTFPGAVFAQNHIASVQGQTTVAFAIKSSAFVAGAEIPQRYTCMGDDVSPALEWSGAPAKTVSFALIMDDPDAPSGTWTHWVLWNLPAKTQGLAEGVAKRDPLENNARQGRNSDNNIGYNGPCPPSGRAHRYFFRLYALDENLELPPGAGRVSLLEAIKGHILGQAEYMGRFRR